MLRDISSAISEQPHDGVWYQVGKVVDKGSGEENENGEPHKKRGDDIHDYRTPSLA